VQSGQVKADPRQVQEKVPMGVLHFRYRERRRTLRVAMALPIVVHGQNDAGEKFCVRAITRSINKQGALLTMDELVEPGQPLLVVNENTSRSTEARVAHVRRERDGKLFVGLEFVNPEVNFWMMTFPLPGARPLRRNMNGKG
jgi:PilZ domain